VGRRTQVLASPAKFGARIPSHKLGTASRFRIEAICGGESSTLPQSAVVCNRRSGQVGSWIAPLRRGADRQRFVGSMIDAPTASPADGTTPLLGFGTDREFSLAARRLSSRSGDFSPGDSTGRKYSTRLGIASTRRSAVAVQTVLQRGLSAHQLFRRACCVVRREVIRRDKAATAPPGDRAFL